MRRNAAFLALWRRFWYCSGPAARAGKLRRGQLQGARGRGDINRAWTLDLSTAPARPPPPLRRSSPAGSDVHGGERHRLHRSPRQADGQDRATARLDVPRPRGDERPPRAGWRFTGAARAPTTPRRPRPGGPDRRRPTSAPRRADRPRRRRELRRRRRRPRRRTAARAQAASTPPRASLRQPQRARGQLGRRVPTAAARPASVLHRRRRRGPRGAGAARREGQRRGPVPPEAAAAAPLDGSQPARRTADVVGDRLFRDPARARARRRRRARLPPLRLRSTSPRRARPRRPSRWTSASPTAGTRSPPSSRTPRATSPARTASIDLDGTAPVVSRVPVSGRKISAVVSDALSGLQGGTIEVRTQARSRSSRSRRR